ncbi:TspO/MBR family protein [Nonomuraea sp. NPDC003214]
MLASPAIRRFAALPLFVVAVALVATVGSLASANASSDYLALAKPGWAPPAWLFGPVWTLLYGMIAVAGWMVWRVRGWTPALGVYAVQLVLNAAWTPLFFAAGQYGLAFGGIVLLWLAIIVNIVAFWRLRRSAALLLMPYLLWVSFAAALNAAIWQLN